MDSPVITLREFDAYMREGGFKYSLYVISQLEEAAIYARQAKNASETEAKELYGSAYLAQISALESAEIESEKGPIVEPKLKYMKRVDEQYIHQIYNKWQQYLEHIGAHIQEVEFHD